jgi:hypothetical protein
LLGVSSELRDESDSLERLVRGMLLVFS